MHYQPTRPQPPRRSFTVEYKLKVVAWHKANGNVKLRTAKKFGVDTKRVRDWLLQEQELLARNFGKESQRKKLRTREARCEELDSKVTEWFHNERSAGRFINDENIKQKAYQIGQDTGLLEFKASNGWLRNWKRRNHVWLMCSNRPLSAWEYNRPGYEQKPDVDTLDTEGLDRSTSPDTESESKNVMTAVLEEEKSQVAKSFEAWLEDENEQKLNKPENSQME